MMRNVMFPSTYPETKQVAVYFIMSKKRNAY